LAWVNEAEKHLLVSQWDVFEILEIQQREAQQEAEQKEQE